MNEIFIRARINNNGELVIYGKRDLDEFVKLTYEKNNKKACDLLLNINVLPENGKSKRIGYIKKAIYPQFRDHFKKNGLRMLPKHVEFRVNQMTNTARNKNISELTWKELGDFIEETKEIAAEHFGFYIDDPIVI